VVVEGDFPVAFVQRDLSAIGNPTDGATYSPGGDLLLVDLASPSADRQNITAGIVQGPHDVSDPEVSYDDKRLLFAMKAPQWRNNATWNLFEYDTEARTLTRLIADDALANAGDDVDPAYLPDGRIVFSSNRQAATRKKMQDEGKVR
jgi:Tol biopolymer transport system component